MKTLRRWVETFVCLVWVWSATVALAAQPPAGQSEFVPVSELPPSEQLPAAPLLIGAYAFVWLVLLIYVWSIGRRLQRVDAELSRVERLVSRSPAAKNR